MSDGVDQAGSVSRTLAAAGIPEQRCGTDRTAGLTAAEAALYRWVLEQFATRGRPSGAALCAEARDLELGPAAAIDALAREDLVHLDDSGEVAVAYPFSGRTTRHRVALSARHDVFAMCALDALGMAAMLGEPVDVRSSDPTSGGPITVHVDPDSRAAWEPTGAVVLAGADCACDGPSYQGCCGVLNFFGSRAAVEDYLARNPDVRGHPITIPEAVAAGSAIFGRALAPGRTTAR